MLLGHCHSLNIPHTSLPSLHLQVLWRLYHRIMRLAALSRWGYAWSSLWSFSFICQRHWLLASCLFFHLTITLTIIPRHVNIQIGNSQITGPLNSFTSSKALSFEPLQPPAPIVTHLYLIPLVRTLLSCHDSTDPILPSQITISECPSWPFFKSINPNLFFF